MDLLPIIVFLIKICVISGEKPVCDNNTLASVDQSMAILMNTGKFYRKYPTNKQELKPFCNEQYHQIKRIEDFKTRCMKNFPKQITAIAIYTFKSMVNNLCKRESKKLARFLDGAHCANAAMKEFDRCNNRYIDALLGIFHAKDSLKVPFVCCEFFKTYSCMETGGRNHSDICTQTRIDATIEYMKDAFTNSLTFMCGDYTEDSDKCDTLPQRPKKRKTQVRPNSFLLPFIDVLDSFPEI